MSVQEIGYMFELRYWKTGLTFLTNASTGTSSILKINPFPSEFTYTDDHINTF